MKDKFANPRNAAAGSFETKKSKRNFKIPLKYFSYGFGVIELMIFKKQSEFLNQISEWVLRTNPLSRIVKGIDEIEKQHLKFDSLRSSLIMILMV